MLIHTYPSYFCHHPHKHSLTHNASTDSLSMSLLKLRHTTARKHHHSVSNTQPVQNSCPQTYKKKYHKHWTQKLVACGLGSTLTLFHTLNSSLSLFLSLSPSLSLTHTLSLSRSSQWADKYSISRRSSIFLFCAFVRSQFLLHIGGFRVPSIFSKRFFWCRRK